MFEKRHEKLISTRSFIFRIITSIIIGLLLTFLALLLGMMGYHFFEKMSWLDAFANAAMILSGMGPLEPLKTSAGKLFAGFYAIFSGLAFILIIGIIFAPAVHRILHTFHIDEDQISKKRSKK